MNVKQALHYFVGMPAHCANGSPVSDTMYRVPTNCIRGYSVKNKLEEIRKRLSITQDELALALEVSRQTIISLEKGRYNPSIILAFKIARYFEMSIEEIFIFEEEAQ